MKTKPLRILLIEDDPDVSETIVSILQGFYVIEHIEHIVSGDQFKQGVWRSGDWDLAILDLMMPGITGFEVCDTLRHYPATISMPILALTGYDTLQNEERIKKAGANGYMAKPFEISQFLVELKRLIGPSGQLL